MNEELNNKLWDMKLPAFTCPNQTTIQIGEVQIFIKQGNIVAEEVDAITNAANGGLILGGGVAGAVKQAGGPSI